MKSSLRELAVLLLSTLCLLTIAYAQITPLGDSYVNTADPTTNYGSKTLLDVDGASQVTYIQFNLASIPATASVSQATLKLYVNAVTTAGTFNVDYVNGAWTENTIDASNAPPVGATIASDVSTTTADKNQYILINVTTAVQAWLSGSETNNGIALVANGPFNATFDSKENTTTSHPAELDIAFAGGDGTITGVTTASGSGLMGGGTSGTLNLSLTTSCAANQVLEWNGSAWACSKAGTGTITGVTAGSDLTGGGTSGTVTLNLDTTKVPQLNTPNTFTGNQTVNGNLGVTGAATVNGIGLNGGGSGTTATSEISGNPSTTSGSGGLFLAASDAVNIGNNTGLLFVGPTSGQWEQGPSSTGGPTNFMSIALNSSATAAGNISFNTPIGVPVQTGRYGGSFTNTLDDGNNNMTVLGWIWQKGRNYLQSNPSNPTSTSRTSFNMMGLGSILKLTPNVSGTVVIKIDSEAKNTVDGNGIQFEIFYGTGTAPSNGSPTTGTQAGPTFERDFWGQNTTAGFGTNLRITGLTVGTAYWFDIALKSLGSGSSNATIQNIEFYIEEI